MNSILLAWYYTNFYKTMNTELKRTYPLLVKRWKSYLWLAFGTRLYHVSKYTWGTFHSGFDFVPCALGHFVARGRKGHVCSKLSVPKLYHVSKRIWNLFDNDFNFLPVTSLSSFWHKISVTFQNTIEFCFIVVLVLYKVFQVNFLLEVGKITLVTARKTIFPKSWNIM